MLYDCVIKNGRVIDPSFGVDEVKDIYVKGGYIAPPPAPGEREEAKEVINAAGCMVMPGLVDFHTHLGYQMSDFGLNTDLYTMPNGITTAVDAGSGGTANFEGMLNSVFLRSTIDIRCFLSLAATGIITERYLENLDPARYDAEKVEYLLDKYGKYIVGFKTRVGRNTSKDLDMLPLKAAVEMGTRFDRKVTVHATDIISGYDKVMEILRPGDILCHCFQATGDHTILNEDGKVCEAVRAGREKGVLFDLACGRVNYSIRVMRRALEEGFLPDIVSTDIIGFSIYGPKIHSLLSVMSFCLAMGMKLEDLVRAVTATPASVIGMSEQVGSLCEGKYADIFITRLEDSPMDIVDKFGEIFHINSVFVPLMTIKRGKYSYRNIKFNPFT